MSRYCQYCDICQRTIPKGRCGKTPLVAMPIIGEPFARVAIDLVGPLPMSGRKHRWILTLVDCATCYPEAIPMKGIDTIECAEELVNIFSRTGMPQEILSDRGSQFVSDLMREISRLLSVRQLQTTPYHAQCNGLVERWNGTLRRMIQKMAAEKPIDWDRYIPALLFSYREVAQASLGFSPFELVYGRSVRGPMSVLRDIWADEDINEQTKTTYQYVLELRERLESTCKLAHDELRKAQGNQHKWFNKKAKAKHLKEGDQVLLLLPKKMRHHGLTAKPSKCEIGHAKLDLLGHVVGGGSIQPQDRKIEKILQMRKPETKKELRSFLGTVGFHQKYIDKYAEKGKALTDLLKKGEPNQIKWDAEYNESFQTLKTALTQKPILRLPNFEKQFVLQTDASDSGLGAVLLQEHDGVNMPVMYISRKLNAAETSYSTIERECLALFWATKRLHVYLYGTEFILEIDHQPLAFVNRANIINDRVMQWTLHLQMYRYQVRRVKGSANTTADLLSSYGL